MAALQSLPTGSREIGSFDEIDSNGDGVIDRQEYSQHQQQTAGAADDHMHPAEDALDPHDQPVSPHKSESPSRQQVGQNQPQHDASDDTRSEPTTKSKGPAVDINNARNDAEVMRLEVCVACFDD